MGKIPEVGSFVSITLRNKGKVANGKTIKATETRYSDRYATRVEVLQLDGETDTHVRFATWVKSRYAKKNSESDWRFSSGNSWVVEQELANEVVQDARQLGIFE